MKFSAEWRAKMSLAARNRKKREGRKPEVDPRIRKAHRRLLWRMFEKIGGEKEGRTHEQLGYSAADLKKHLESLFQDGMSWENYGCRKGQWNIDHVKPLSLWPKGSNPAEVNALRNLQPMWASDNVRKSNEWEKLE